MCFVEVLSVHGKALWGWMRCGRGGDKGAALRMSSIQAALKAWTFCLRHITEILFHCAGWAGTAALPFCPARGASRWIHPQRTWTLNCWDLQCWILQLIAWCIPKISFSDLHLLSAQGRWTQENLLYSLNQSVMTVFFFRCFIQFRASWQILSPARVTGRNLIQHSRSLGILPGKSVMM